MNAKGLFLLQGFLSQMGDRMWFFAAYLLLAKAFPNEQILLGAIYGLSLATSAALFSSSLGAWIDRTPRLRAAFILLCVQNLSVAACASVQIVGLLNLLAPSFSPWLIALATVLACSAHLASIGMQIVLERDWVPQVFSSSEELTSVNAWMRRIDQLAMLLGPAAAGPLIGFNAVFGATLIATWNVVSLFAELMIMFTLYKQTQSLREPLEVRVTEQNDKSNSWSKWSRSKVFVPGLALAVLFANVFQLSYIAQAYIATHCISDELMGLVWMAAGVCGLLGTGLYEVIVKSRGVVAAGVIGAVLHLTFVIGTIIGLFLPGSPYLLYRQIEQPEATCSASASFTPGMNETVFPFELEKENFVFSFSAPCSPVQSLWSIGTLIACCAMSRCGLWLFDLAVNQMFQEWVDADERGAVSGAQSAMQNVFDCVHFGIVFVWRDQCSFGNAMLVTAFMMIAGYSYFFGTVAKGNYGKNVTPKQSKLESKEDCVILTQYSQ